MKSKKSNSKSERLKEKTEIDYIPEGWESVSYSNL